METVNRDKRAQAVSGDVCADTKYIIRTHQCGPRSRVTLLFFDSVAASILRHEGQILGEARVAGLNSWFQTNIFGMRSLRLHVFEHLLPTTHPCHSLTAVFRSTGSPFSLLSTSSGPLL